jgi:prepilin signal peptidase PulO-like enzyme (type II secretory pathway)
LAKWSARRSAAQPLLLAIAEEKRVLAEVIARPQAYPVVAELRCEDFSVLAHRRIWEEIAEVGNAALDGAAATTDEELAEVEKLLDGVSFDSALSGLDDEAGSEVGELRKVEGAGTLSTKELLDLGGKVLAAYDDRTRTAGAVPPVPGQDDQAPFVREVKQPGRNRFAWTVVLTALGWGAMPYLISKMALHSVGGSLLAGAAVLVLGVTTIEIALVDYDTFYVDYPVLAVGGGLAWLLTVGSALMTHRPSALLAVLIAVVAFAFFEAMNLIYKRVRQRHGMGFGDSVLLLVAIGVPAALTGSPRLGWYSLIVALLAAIAGRVGQLAAKRAEGGSPFALGPYLAMGWLLTWILLAGSVS